uniref:hypothetical protein n=1 Tax=Flavobacterium beibuense TaxID=657326 RepID=UPI003A8DA0AD
MKFFLFALLFVTVEGKSQDKLENAYYILNLPNNTTVKLFQHTNEDFANIDSYKFFEGEKPKYVLYMMSNKLEADVTVREDNYIDFLNDIGALNVTNVSRFNNFFKVNFNFKDREAIECVMYININGDILNRFLLMYPNKTILNNFENEVNIFLKNII